MSTVKLVPNNLLRDCSLAGTYRQSNWYQTMFYEFVGLLVHVGSQTGTRQSSTNLSACWYMSTVKLVPTNLLRVCRLVGTFRQSNWYQTIFYEFVGWLVHVDSQTGTKQSSTRLFAKGLKYHDPKSINWKKNSKCFMDPSRLCQTMGKACKRGRIYSFRMGEEYAAIDTNNNLKKRNWSMSTRTSSIFKDPNVAKHQSHLHMLFYLQTRPLTTSFLCVNYII